MNKHWSLVLKIAIYILAIGAYWRVDAQILISSTTECNRCLNDGWSVCKLASAENVAVCCDQQEDYSDDCTIDVDNFNSGNFAMCSNEVPRLELQKFACPVSQ